MGAGLLAGILYIAAASANVWVNSGRGPLWTFQSVAGGLLGRQTFEGGLRSTALGLTLHFLIALTTAAVYYAASRKLKLTVQKPFLSGAIFGIAVWVFMNLIVLPLTPLKITQTFASVSIGLMIHVLFVAWPIALTIRRFSK